MFGVYRTEPSDTGGESQSFTLGMLLAVLWKRLWLVALVTIVLVGVAVGLSLTQTPQYQASVRILVGQDRGFTESPTEAIGLQQLTQTMDVAADSRTVIEAVIENLNLGISVRDFQENLEVSQIAATQFIEISYTDPNPRTARLVADELGEEFSNRIDEVSNSSNPITATLYERASVPDEPVSPQPLRNGILALGLGLLLGLALAFLLEYLDDSWHSPEEAEQLVGAPIFGVIPEYVVSGEGGGGEAAPGGKEEVEQPRSAGAVAVVPEVSETSEGGANEKRDVRAGVEAASLEMGEFERLISPAGAALVVGSRFESVGETFAGIIGYKREEVEGRERSSVGLPEGASITRGSEVSAQGRVESKDGRMVWVHQTVTRLGGSEEEEESSLIVVRDITEEKRDEAEVRDLREAKELSSERLRRFVEHSPVIFQSLTPEGEQLAANSAWREFWHAPSGEDAGPNALQNGAGHMGELPAYVRESLNSRKTVSTPELQLEAINGGGERWIRGYISPVLGKGERVLEVMIFLEDLTPRKAYETVAREREQERERLEKALNESLEEKKRAEDRATESQKRFEMLTARVTGLLSEAREDDEQGRSAEKKKGEG